MQYLHYVTQYKCYTLYDVLLPCNYIKITLYFFFFLVNENKKYF